MQLYHVIFGLVSGLAATVSQSIQFLANQSQLSEHMTITPQINAYIKLYELHLVALLLVYQIWPFLFPKCQLAVFSFFVCCLVLVFYRSTHLMTVIK